MVTFQLFKLRFLSPLHIGDQHEEEGISFKAISSDTLHAALIASLAKVGVSIPEDGNLGFTLSSTFPFYQEREDSAPIYFLPKPLQTVLPKLSDVAMMKKVKKVQWVDAALYSKVLAGEFFLSDADSLLPYVQESYLSLEKIPEDVNGSCEFVQSEVMQRVSIAERTGKKDAKPYFVDRILFKDQSGIYFLAMGDTTMLEKGLQLLSQEGFGTDRHVGFGSFVFTTDTLTLELPDEADFQVSLSLFIPETQGQLQELLSSDSVAYDFTRRGGWITTYPYNTVRKNAIYGFTPGSVFKKTSAEPVERIGKIADLTPLVGDLTPSHKIWRNGFSIMLPLKMKSSE